MTTKPPARGLEQRLSDTRARLENDVDLWVATASATSGVHLIPLSYLWDGTAILVSTPATRSPAATCWPTAGCGSA